jgi:hypothetical protein
MSIEQVQNATLLLIAALVALMVWQWRATLRVFSNYFGEQSSAFSLGAMRVAIFGTIYSYADPVAVVSLCELPKSMRRYLPGWHWLEAYDVFNPQLGEALTQLLLVFALLATLGLFTRVSTVVAALLTVYVLGVPNFFNKIDHNNHFTVLAALVLAAAPCGDALSLDRLIRRFRGFAAPAPANAYALPIRMIWLLFGTVYLFPGIWKLWISGDLWFAGTQLKALLYREWGRRPDFMPIARVDESDMLLAALGASTILFEVGFIVALLWRPSRVVAAISAILFRYSVWKVMGIRFNVWLPLVLLIDFPQLTDWLRARIPPLDRGLALIGARTQALLQPVAERLPAAARPAPARSRVPALLVGGVLVLAQFITGFARIDTWPVACHPQFSSRIDDARDQGTRLTLVLDSPGKDEVDLGAIMIARIGKSRTNKLIHQIEKYPSSGRKLFKRSSALVATLREAGVTIHAGDRITVYKETWSLFPLGARANMKRKAVDRYEVLEDSSFKKVKK